MIQLSNESNNFKIKMSLKKKTLLFNYLKHQSLTSHYQQVLFHNFSEYKINKMHFFQTKTNRI